MKKILILMTMILVGLAADNQLFSQCATWVGAANEDQITDNHTIYRGSFKAKDYAGALEFWEKAYKAAPAADGNRDFHFLDGIKIYKELLKTETDEGSKTAMKGNITRLYDEAISCYETKGIKLPKCKGDDCYTKRMGYLYGRKGFDMYYDLNSLYSDNLATFAKGVELTGNDTEYIVLSPYATIAVYQFSKELLSKEETRAIHAQLNEIADHNIANNEKYGAYYQQAKDAMNGQFAQIERQIFDCDYFKVKHMPEYDADPNDPEKAKNLYNLLKRRGCDETDPFLAELKGKYEKWAAGVNAQKKAEFEANNPGLLANKAYKAGDYQGAMSKYKEAIQGEADPSRQAGYHLSIASIQFRKLKQLSAAKASAKKALELRPNWGKANLMLGDLYATMSRNCKDSFEQRVGILGAIKRYNMAKKDPEYASEAAEKAGKYYSSRPDKEEAFMKNMKKGQTVTCKCGIGESVQLEFK